MAKVKNTVTVRDLLFYAVHVHRKAYSGALPRYFMLHPSVVAQLMVLPESRYEIALKADGSLALWNGIQINESPKHKYPLYCCEDGKIEFL